MWDLVALILTDPVRAAQAIFGATLWSRQAELVRSVFQHRMSAWATGHAVGKTEATTLLIPLWLMSHPDSYVLVTSASWANVEGKIFPALKQRMKSCRLREYRDAPVNKTFWSLGPGWEARGCSPQHPESMQGWHSQTGTLVIVDEASGLDLAIHTAILSLLTNPADHVVYLGNPIHSSGPFVDAINSPTWFHGKISSLETPNIVEGRTVIPGLASQEWLDGTARPLWGEDSPEWQSRVLGLVPDQDASTFIGYSTLTQAAKREIPDWRSDRPLRLAIDPAWSETGDRSVFLVRGPRAVHHLHEERGMRLKHLLAKTRQICIQFENSIEEIYIDRTGVGTGVFDATEDKPPAGVKRVIGVAFGAQPTDPVKYYNLRAEAWGRMKDALLAGLAIPPDMVDRFFEAAQVQYFPSLRGQIQLEDKDEVKKRIGRSPDVADALAVSYAEPPGQAAFSTVRPALQMGRRPIIYSRTVGDRTVPYIHLEQLHPDTDRPGVLLRSAWISRTAASACIWVHIDSEGCWTVYDALRLQATPVTMFWSQVLDMSPPECNYAIDVFGALDVDPARGQYHLQDEILRLCAARHRAMPAFLSPDALAGNAGLDYLDRLFLSTLARYPRDPYWTANPVDPATLRHPECIYVWPEAVVADLQLARIRKPGGYEQFSDAQSDPREEMVSGGGAYVRCLRQLAIQGAAYLT